MDQESPQTYCDYVANLENNNLHKIYHDEQYGFPIKDDNELFGRLILEINQAGLSWTTILKKQNNFRKAYSGFKIKKIAEYDDNAIKQLLDNSGIIRNKLKVNAAIYNAQQILSIQKEFGSFRLWLENNQFRELDDWVNLFKKIFKFTGKEITKEFLISSGILKGAHTKDCPIFYKISS
ncbi:MAG: DNA-3-methyladenine glycosylase I [Candidatus Marinimicrobia bacterium]|jgi:DNA-3-methyladenine glycosylase I|nr:DNA-3-methyladenine glycosylase I [Candidatus Neomarinimicrobiota bacterium]